MLPTCEDNDVCVVCLFGHVLLTCEHNRTLCKFPNCAYLSLLFPLLLLLLLVLSLLHLFLLILLLPLLQTLRPLLLLLPLLGAPSSTPA
jgi:hypothetical protein